MISWKKPTIVGATILDLAKYHMYDLHYIVMKKNFFCRLLYSDTDSVLYEIKERLLQRTSRPVSSQDVFLICQTTLLLIVCTTTRQKLVPLKFKHEY